MLSIVQAPNSVLSTRSKRINNLNKEVLKLIDEMKETLDLQKDPVGVGLAAPQVGRSLQLFLAKPTENGPTLVFINPVIKQIATDLKTDEHRENQRKSAQKSAEIKKLEGCLSLKDIWGEVRRSSRVTVDYLDEHNTKHKKTFSGFPATIIQHEIDHLYGILFPKRVLEQKGTLYKQKKNDKGEDIFEEIDL